MILVVRGTLLDNAGAGWETCGIKLSEEARKVAEQKGIKAYKSLDDAAFPNGFFDVVTMFAVIEHLSEPKEVVKVLAEVLKEDGLFVIMTGDAKSLKATYKAEKWHMYRPPEHLYFFCAKSLNFLMDLFEFRKIKTIYTDGGMTRVPFRPLKHSIKVSIDGL